jgi:DNA-binding Lrp family transcriptional regulator
MNLFTPAAAATTTAEPAEIDCLDHALVLATQAGLPLVAEPYAELAADVGTSPEDVMARLQRLLDAGVIRRIGAVPNHYAIGYAANGMSVWDVDDAQVDALGTQVGALSGVTHCYRRPRALPAWPYNLFAMLHGDSRAAVLAQAEAIAALLGPACRGHDILFSTRMLKKTGLRLVSA